MSHYPCIVSALRCGERRTTLWQHRSAIGARAGALRGFARSQHQKTRLLMDPLTHMAAPSPPFLSCFLKPEPLFVFRAASFIFAAIAVLLRFGPGPAAFFIAPGPAVIDLFGGMAEAQCFGKRQTPEPRVSAPEADHPATYTRLLVISHRCDTQLSSDTTFFPICVAVTGPPVACRGHRARVPRVAPVVIIMYRSLVHQTRAGPRVLLVASDHPLLTAPRWATAEPWGR